jgi:uncharacterized Zn finger protein
VNARWEDWGPSSPLRVEGGLTARSARGSIGSTWWSKRFITVLESFAVGGRLTRGKAYARKGQVLSLDLIPGVVSGKVQGSRATPYEVWITLPVLPAEVWHQVEEAICEQALFAAQLLGGELPAELEQVVADAGGSLFPTAFTDLSMRCTCPDWGMPCKHLAAAFYLLAETFDDDPFRILLWRGRSREQLMAAARAGAGPTTPGATTPGTTATADVPDPVPAPITAATELADLPVGDVADMLTRFWVPPVPLPPRPPTLESPPDLLLRQLAGPPATLGGAALATALDDVYRRLGRPTLES